MKIAVYEDLWNDVRLRYKRFLGEHDVQIYLHLINEKIFTRGREYLIENGFPSETLHFGLPQEIPEADLHFCDGLNGHCFNILPKLPKGKSFLTSGDEEIREIARSKGFNVLTTLRELEGIVASANSRAKSKSL